MTHARAPFGDGFFRFFSIGLIIGGYAIPFGILATRSGLSIFETCLMSLTVFAGASQFMALSLLRENVSLWTLAVATFAINSRHLLYGINIGNKYKEAPLGSLLTMSYGIVDETYAFNTVGPGRAYTAPQFFLGTAFCAYLCWNTGTLLGAVIGSVLTFSTAGLDFAMLAVFISMIGCSVKTGQDYATLASSLGLAACLYAWLGGQWHLLLVGAIIPLGAGVLGRRQT